MAARIMNALAPAIKRKKMNSPMLVLPARKAPDKIANIALCISISPGQYDECDGTYNRNAPLTPIPVRDIWKQQSGDNTASLEQSVGRGDEVGAVLSCIKLKITDEGWLPECSADDGGCVTIAH
jgi:hypothetical protein